VIGDDKVFIAATIAYLTCMAVIFGGAGYIALHVITKCW
jgi:hypothetical protein